MKKSSLGRRSSTVTLMSERIRSFGGDGRESVQQKQKPSERESRMGSEKKSMLLKPGFTRRAGSADRGSIDSVVTAPRSAVRSRSQARSADRGSTDSAATRSAVRSKSQANIIRNSTTPKTLFPVHSNLPTGSASSSRSLSMDSGRISSIGGTKKIPKDPRPINEKSFQIAAEKKVVNFLDQYESPDTFIGNKTSIRQITQSKFVDIVHILLKHLDDSIVITKSNYVEELPFLMKKFCYPGKVDRSWLIIVNAQHTWHYVIALFVWLVDVVECMNGVDIKEAMYPQSLQLNQSSDPEESVYDFKILIPYLQTCYAYFNKGLDTAALNEAFEKRDVELIDELLKSKDCCPESINNLKRECDELKNQLNDPELRSEEENFHGLKDVVANLKKDNAVNEEYIHGMHNYIEHVENKIIFIKEDRESILKNIEQNEQKKEKYKKLIKEQKITKEEKEQILAKRVSLECAIQYDGECYDEYEKIVCLEDIKIVGIREKLNKEVQEYNKQLALNTLYEPSLKSAIVDNQVLHQGADLERSAVDKLLKNIRTDCNKKFADIQSQVTNTKELMQKNEENLQQKHKIKSKLGAQLEKLESDICFMKKEKKTAFETKLSTYLKQNEEMADYIKALTQKQNELADIEADLELLKKNALKFFSGLQKIYMERAAVIQGTLNQAAERLKSLLQQFKE